MEYVRRQLNRTIFLRVLGVKRNNAQSSCIQEDQEPALVVSKGGDATNFCCPMFDSLQECWWWAWLGNQAHFQ